MTPIEKAITKARINLITQQPFFGSLIMRLPMVVDNNQPSMCTDGRTIRYNETFAAGLSPDELCGVLAHEVMHPALGHHARRGDRDPQNWNRAADYAINPLLRAAGLTLPADALDDPAYHGMSAEEIYGKLPPPPPGGGGGGFGEVVDGTDEDGDPASPAELEQSAQDWKIAAQAVESACKRQGNMPAGVQRALDLAKQATVDWKSVLRRFIVQQLPAEVSWSRANRRFVGQGLYLPGIRKENMGGFCVFIDTSGSIDQNQLAEFGAEVSAMVAECRPAWVEIGYADAKLHNIRRFGPGDPLVFEAAGGGGTDFRPAFEHVAKLDEQPAAVLYLTDMYGYFPSQEPDVPTLWVSNSTIDTAPFGEVVRMRS